MHHCTFGRRISKRFTVLSAVFTMLLALVAGSVSTFAFVRLQNGVLGLYWANGTRNAIMRPVTMGKIMGAGKDATSWTIGWRRRDQVAERPIRIPAGTVQRIDRARAPAVRRNVAPRAAARAFHSFADTAVRRWTSRSAPQIEAAARPLKTPTSDRPIIPF